ncbi:2-hydroxychromene-2-carboxylate isomerase [Bordetella genomosp. 10]|uniref:2-hydroxychromene-2-carboxylate isomerase n=1 Tax=Bordetella genomosp. 10 TaxID=1416804 RepID=A0A261RZA8_9BORD|nr:2-hydroxychromene-2-carboxylate isomerase [Bordetella genomosp. 10]OZI30087.1 2-hydroxychromene-2-carboxylate isomerase [Bordetella genomosp. 10]
MQKSIDYYFWLNSDWAYLGAHRLDALADRLGVKVNYLPVDLPDVYRRTGGVLLGQRSPERQAYRVAELKRWCRELGMHVNPAPRYMCPDADLASRLVIAALREPAPITPLYTRILEAEWCEERDISDPEVLRDILRRAGYDAEALFQRAAQADIEAIYRRNTDAAVAAGVFGSPSYVFEGEVFWGQDRLDLLEKAIRLASPAA